MWYALPLAIPFIGVIVGGDGARKPIRNKRIDTHLSKAVQADQRRKMAMVKADEAKQGLQLRTMIPEPMKRSTVNESDFIRFDPAAGRGNVAQTIPGFVPRDSGGSAATVGTYGSFPVIDEQTKIGGQGYDGTTVSADGGAEFARASAAGYVGRPLNTGRYAYGGSELKPPKREVTYEERYGDDGKPANRLPPQMRAVHLRALASEGPGRFAGQGVASLGEEDDGYTLKNLHQGSDGYHPSMRPGLTHMTETIRGLEGVAEFRRGVAHASALGSYYAEHGEDTLAGDGPSQVSHGSKLPDRLESLESGYSRKSRTVGERSALPGQGGLSQDVRPVEGDQRITRFADGGRKSSLYEVDSQGTNLSQFSRYERTEDGSLRPSKKLQDGEIPEYTGSKKGRSEGTSVAMPTFTYEELRTRATAHLTVDGREGIANAKMNAGADLASGEQERPGRTSGPTRQLRQVVSYEPSSLTGFTFGGQHRMDTEDVDFQLNMRRRADLVSGERLGSSAVTASLVTNPFIPPDI